MKKLLRAFIPEYTPVQITNSVYKFSPAFFLNLLWLTLCSLAVFYFGFEKDKGFDRVVILISVAFLVYIFIPLAFRKLFLLMLAIVAEIYLFGIKIGVGVTLTMIFFTAVTYIKGRILRNITVLISLLTGIVLAAGIVNIPLARLIVLSSAIFLMLRYIYLMYELNYFKTPPVFIDRLCYLFLIPNACFPLFPALSPVEYLKTFYDAPSEVAFKRGLHWITTGIIHILIYRVIYLYFSPSPYDIDDFPMWLWFVLSSYSLIFRLSGLFYLASGFLQLFGFRLPQIFDHVYFASSFPDLWRRVNLYWRAFMMRVFYYPLLFKFKKFRQGPVIFFGVMTMFVLSWMLHSWQWFWIKGTYYFYPTDMIFWFILGLIISFHALKAYLKLAKKSYTAVSTNFITEASKITTMFFLMSLLWSLWTSSSLSEFFFLTKFVKAITLKEALMFIVAVTLFILVAAGVRFVYIKYNWFGFVFREIKPVYGAILCLSFPVICEVWRNTEPRAAEAFIANRMNKRDNQAMERGYYEQILNNENRAVELLNADKDLKKWNLDRDAYVKKENELMKEFKTSYTTSFKGAILQTNSFGLRDKEVNIEKKNGNERWAFVGGSYVMGSGVSNGQTFSDQLEEQLKNVEILNFGVGGYFLIQNVYVVEHKVTQFKPDRLFLFIHSDYRYRSLDNFARLVQKNTQFSYPFLERLANKAGVRKGMCHLEIFKRLEPFVNELFGFGFYSIAKKCRDNNIKPVLVYLPANADTGTDPDKKSCLKLAERENFIVIDLSDVYQNQNAEDIQISWWDAHPNVKGHKLIADSLYRNLKRNEHFFKLVQ